jgi:hypothetical protein
LTWSTRVLVAATSPAFRAAPPWRLPPSARWSR